MQQFTPIWAALLTWSAYTVHALLVALAAVFGIWSVPLLPSVTTRAGLALVLLGLFLYGAAAVVMRSFARMSGRRADQLITSGVYRFTRHPQLVGWALVLLGIALWGRSWLALLLTALYLVGVIFLMPIEERKLIALYGQEYRNYQRRTPRFFGWPKH